MAKETKKQIEIPEECEELKVRLDEAEETLSAIQNGQVDAVVVKGPDGTQVFTLKGADYAYRILIEEMNEGVAILTTDLTIYYCNSQLASMLKIPLENMMGKPLNEVIPHEKFNECNMPFINGPNSSCEEEIVIKALDGTLIPVHINIRFLEKINGYYMILNDLTEQKKAEETLQKSKESFKTLAENSPDLIIRLDKELNYIYLNSKVIEHTGKHPEFFIGKNIKEVGTPEEYNSLWIEDYEKSFKTGKIQHREYEFPTIRGLRTFETVTVPEFNINGEIETLLSVTRDITERKESEEELNDLLENLKRSNEELEKFAYVASHDLQEPLRTIASFTQLLERRYKGKFDSDADEFMGYIVDAAIRMKDQIEGLLEFSRVATKGKEFEQVNLKEVLNQTINILNASITECKADIMYDKLPVVMGDFGQLQRVFQNLISNAIKFRKCEEQLRIHISSRKDTQNNEYVLSVTDNGIGIEEQYLERIFVIFQRLHTRDVYKGTGIGLSVVQKIIERHGGRIWVESEYNKGSTFYFTIPIRT